MNRHIANKARDVKKRVSDYFDEDDDGVYNTISKSEPVGSKIDDDGFDPLDAFM